MAESFGQSTSGYPQALQPFDSAAEIARIAQAMRANGVAIYANGSLRVELHASAFAPLAPGASATPDAPNEDACACTHSLIVEHNSDGLCLKGCAVETCAQKAQP